MESENRMGAAMSRIGISRPLHSDGLILAAARPGIMMTPWPTKEAGPAEPVLDHQRRGPQVLPPIHRATTLLVSVTPFQTTTWSRGAPALPACVTS